MNQPASQEEFVDKASRLQGDDKVLYVNQSDYTPEEMILSDEDTAGGVNMQIIRLLASNGKDAIYWQNPIYDSGELEQMNVELEALETFTRKVISLEEMEAEKSRFDIRQDSVQDGNDPS